MHQRFDIFRRGCGRVSLVAATVMVCLILVASTSSPVAAAPVVQPAWRPARPPAAAGPTDPAQLETFLDGVMAAHLKAHHVPGAVVAVVKDGALFFAKGYGYADLEEGIRVDVERTLFRPGSVSKLFTWTAVMQLVEDGRLSLDTDVNEYLDFEIPATYPQPITLAHLMTHTPGFEDHGQGLFALQEEDLVSLEAYVKSFVPARVYPPGEVEAYSNYGTALAGYIVQRVSGEPFEAYVEGHIFEPLGMDRSTFRQPLPSELAPDMARGYGYARGAYLPGDYELIAGRPAGSMTSSATDMARFMIAHLQGGRYGSERILDAVTVAEMQEAQYVPDPRSSGIGYGFFRSSLNGRRIVSHEGDTFLFHSGLYLFPEENVGLFVSYNSAGGSAARVELLKAFADRYFPAPEPQPVEPPADFRSRVDAYTGEYYLARANYTSAEKLVTLFQVIRVAVGPEGHLVIDALGETDQYVEVEPGLVRQTRGEDRVIFILDEDGQVTRALPADIPPFTLFKAPWYATLTFSSVLLIGGLVLFLLTLVGWGVAYFVTRARDREALPSPPARLARWVAAGFVVLSVVFLVGLFTIMGNVNPTYGVPDVFFGEAPGLSALTALTVVLVALAAAMVVMTVLAWVRGFWSWFGRGWYTLVTLMALSWVWLLAYWNILGPGF
jgi:CubicO group peptidase (beta-lactamase class C family)